MPERIIVNKFPWECILFWLLSSQGDMTQAAIEEMLIYELLLGTTFSCWKTISRIMSTNKLCVFSNSHYCSFRSRVIWNICICGLSILSSPLLFLKLPKWSNSISMFILGLFQTNFHFVWEPNRNEEFLKHEYFIWSEILINSELRLRNWNNYDEVVFCGWF